MPVRSICVWHSPHISACTRYSPRRRRSACCPGPPNRPDGSHGATRASDCTKLTRSQRCSGVSPYAYTWRQVIRTCIHKEPSLSAVRTMATDAISGNVECAATLNTGCCGCRTRQNDYRLRRYSTGCLGELLDLCDDRIDLTVAQQVVEV